MLKNLFKWWSMISKLWGGTEPVAKPKQRSLSEHQQKMLSDQVERNKTQVTCSIDQQGDYCKPDIKTDMWDKFDGQTRLMPVVNLEGHQVDLLTLLKACELLHEKAIKAKHLIPATDGLLGYVKDLYNEFNTMMDAKW